ncbi:hypothetical protein LTR84_005269 [Exophiala bonariae]|uniref:Elongator complex protein 6 n=1 Tax=Exophiala bonariae TaxID=1690606 RepID=A0AAV9NTA5_9EURO|nr:hypothetical protein LTR84_005269 [Exophiala bonariae]
MFGLDILLLVKKGRIVYVDGLTSYGNADAGEPGTDNPVGSSSFRLKSLGLEEIEHKFKDAVRLLTNHPISAQSMVGSRTPARTNAASARMPAGSTTPSPAAGMPVVVIDGIDFVLACQQPSISVLSLQSTLATLRTKSQSLIVTCSADGPLLHNHDGVSTSTTPLEADHALLVTSMAHQSQWLFQLRGLDTGTAEDVSGVVRVSRGGAQGGGEKEEDMVDAEWLYQVKGDGSVRVWGRGE